MMNTNNKRRQKKKKKKKKAKKKSKRNRSELNTWPTGLQPVALPTGLLFLKPNLQLLGDWVKRCCLWVIIYIILWLSHTRKGGKRGHTHRYTHTYIRGKNKMSHDAGIQGWSQSVSQFSQFSQAVRMIEEIED